MTGDDYIHLIFALAWIEWIFSDSLEADMTTYSEMLEQPQIITKVESLLSGHIMAVYIKAGYNPPVPILHDKRFIYADPASEKYARRLREGMKLFAEVLDQLEVAKTKTEGDQANE